MLGALIGLAVVLAIASSSFARLKPIARAMIEALETVNQIGLGLAIEDYEASERAARSLRNQAKNLKKIDIEIFGLNPARNAEFDGYLTAMEETADVIAAAAKKEDAHAALEGLAQLFQSACLACHREFREPAKLLRPPVLYMMNFFNAWREMNRGLAMNDFALVERQAREVATASRTLQRDSAIESTFDIHEPQEREEFEGYLRHLTQRAGEIERAAVEGDAKKATWAMRKMWEDGCISCHEKFR